MRLFFFPKSSLVRALFHLSPSQLFPHPRHPHAPSQQTPLLPPPGILRFAPSLLMPTTAALGVVGALHGADTAHALLDALPPSLLPSLPAAAEVRALYAAHGAAVDVALDSAASLAAVLFAFVAMPLGDLVFGQEPEGEMPHPPPRRRKREGGGSTSSGSAAAATAGKKSAPDFSDFNPYRGWLWAYAFLHLSALAAGAAAAPAMHPLPLLGAALSLGTSGANAFTCAHELGHSRQREERALADLLLAAQLLPYWRTAHAAHHRNVGLPGDPETALLGEGFWAFLPRALRGGLRDALARDAARSRARAAKEAGGERASSPGASSSPPPSQLDLVRHSNVPRWVASAAAATAAAAALGASGAGAAGTGGGESGGAAVAALAGLSLFAVQASFAVLWLEAVEYIEHFGLSRSSPLVRLFEEEREREKKEKGRKKEKNKGKKLEKLTTLLFSFPFPFLFYPSPKNRKRSSRTTAGTPTSRSPTR